MRKLFTLCLLIVSLSASAQWQQTGSKVRYVNGLGIPTKDTAAGVLADSSQIVIRPQDSALYIKYKRTWLRVGGGGGSIAGSGTTNYIPKFTSSTAIGNSQIFDNGTNVGIGTTTPSVRLDIHSAGGTIAQFNGTATSNAYLDFQNAGTTRWRLGNNHLAGANVWTLFNTTSATTAMIVNQSNQVVIGTGNALEKFNVTTATGVVGVMETVSSPVKGNLFYDTDGTGWKFNIGKLQSGTFTPQMTFQDNGNAGINQTAPAGRFVVADGQTLLGTNTNNGVDRLQVSGSASVTSLLGVGTSPSAGTVHIKTTSPSIVLDDNDNAGTAAIRFRPQSASFATRGSIELVSTGSAAPTRFVIASTDTMTFRTNSIERMRITSAGGNVLISKTTDNGIDKLQVNGSIDAKGFAQAYTTKGATYTAATSDYLIDCTSGTFTVNLPDALLNVGRILVIKNSGTGTITVDGFSTQTIDGATTYSLSAQWATVQILCDGSNWKIISKF